MNTREKIFSGLFVAVVVGATILLNSKVIRNSDVRTQIVEQQNSTIVSDKVQLAVDE